MSKLNTYTVKGTKKKTGVDLPKDLTEDVNMRLLAQAIRVYENRRHPGLSQVKTRADVAASKRKIYRQKGTGRARHGKISAPIFVGGGKAHGPDGLKRVLSLPKKMKEKAFKMAVSLKANQGNLFVVEGFSDIRKTKEANELINKIFETEKIKANTNVLIALSEKNKDTVLYLRNLANVSTVPFRSLNAYNVYFSRIIVIDNEVLEEIDTATKTGTKKSKKADNKEKDTNKKDAKKSRNNEVKTKKKVSKK